MGDRLYLVADFNVETLARYLANTAMPGADVTSAPYGQVVRTLATAKPEPHTTAVIWTRPEAIIESFSRARDFEDINADRAIDEVRAFAAAVGQFADRCQYVFVPTWTMPSWDRGSGLLDFAPAGMRHVLARMNIALAESLSGQPGVFVLDAERWLAAAGAKADSPKLWYASKTPFTMAVFEQAAADLRAALDALQGRARRLVIVDLDEVLWGGIVGEVGWAGVTLGGHDHIGEAYVDFQRALKALTRRGVQLAIASRNDEAVALEALDRHPEMQLRRGDFAAWRINWSDKGQNVAEILRELHLGPESAVFIDDSALERARIMHAVPGVLAPDWPADPTLYRRTLASLGCFDTAHVTDEDRARTAMFAAERARRDTLAGVADLDSWLQSLDIRTIVEPLGRGNLERTAQLLNKTNQMNMATRRLSQAELEAWAAQPNHLLLTFRVTDRFGDSGLTGIIGLAVDGTAARLTDFLLSCRVMGRHVEETMLHIAAAHARSRGAASVSAEVVPTARNAPCLEFFRRSRWRQAGTHAFVWELAQAYEAPRFVTVEDRTGVVDAIHR